MSSEFHQLSEKVAQLAAMTQSLRRENADLRLNVAALTTENTELAQRMDEAHQRVAALLDKLPVPAPTPTLADNEEETA
jgi:cell division protein ZapB